MKTILSNTKNQEKSSADFILTFIYLFYSSILLIRVPLLSRIPAL